MKRPIIKKPDGGAVTLTPQQRAFWNKYVDFLESKGLKGSAKLDQRDTGLSRKLFEEFNNLSKAGYMYDAFIPQVQQSIADYRNQAIELFKEGKANYIMQKDDPDYENFMKGLSTVDGWAGSKTTSWKFPDETIIGTDQKNILYKNGGETPEDYYKVNAKLAYYKDRLNQKLKKKNPKAFSEYFKELSELRRSGKIQDAQKYIQQAAYNEFLTPDEVRQELGDSYRDYLESLQAVNRYNVQQGNMPLYGTEEEPGDITNLNYGRRFASLMVTPSFSHTNQTRGTTYSRQYTFTPDEGISFTESGDVSLNPYKDVTKMNVGGFVDSLNRKVNNIQNQVSSGIMNEMINPFSVYNTLSTTSDVVSGIGNSIKAKRDQQFARDQMLADNLFAVDPGGDRGNYVASGTAYGMFRPDQMGAKSPDGMYNGMYYPSMDDGGNFADKYQVPSIDAVVDQGLSLGMLNVPEFALPPADTFSGLPTYNADKEVTVNDSAKFAYKYYTNQKGLPSHIAAGIVGNLYQESRLKPGAVEKTNTANGRGIAQWDKRDRWQGLLSWAYQNQRDPYNLQTQLDYVLAEPGEASRVMQKLKQTKTAEDAALIFGKLYERPSEKHANWDVRTSVARKLHAGQFKDGGEYELSEEEIAKLKADGYNVEYI